MLVSSPRPKCNVTGFPDMVGNVCYKVLQCPDALRHAKTRNSGWSQNTRYINKIYLHYELYITRKVLMRRFRNNKPYYIIFTLSQDISKILLKCPKCYITILTVHCAEATISSKKAQICLPEALIVGQCCNAKGREPDTDKVDKILKWPPLTTPKEVCRFLGLCGTVWVWIPNYSKIVQPLSELYHQDKEFIWNQRQQDAFDEIKKLVTSAPALRPINYTSDNPVILSVDSSWDATGMILS